MRAHVVCAYVVIVGGLGGGGGCSVLDDIIGNDKIDASVGGAIDAPGPPGPDGPPVVCAAPPGGVTAVSVEVYDSVNQRRAAMGVPCAALVPALNLSSERHSAYYLANVNTPACVADPHREVNGCPMFTGVRFVEREVAAGYGGTPASEVMAFGSGSQGVGALELWVDSVWHRTPLFSPWTRDLGFGQATAVATMDFGVGAATSSNAVAAFPYAGQTGVPRHFDGNTEQPPPATGIQWPSGYPITLYVKNGSMNDPLFTVDGSDTPIAHVWITPDTSPYIIDAYVILPIQVLSAATRYRVRADGANGAGTVSFDFTFTTQ